MGERKREREGEEDRRGMEGRRQEKANEAYLDTTKSMGEENGREEGREGEGKGGMEGEEGWERQGRW